MDNVKQLKVLYEDRVVGTLALYEKRLAAFQYSEEWLADGFSISPFSLPLENKVFLPKIDPLDGLHGVFADSLPDGWGRLLIDRLMRKNKIDPARLNCLDRLALVGDSGMGALSYHPEKKLKEEVNDLTLDQLAEECARVLTTEYSDALDTLVSRGGSSGGARPKILTNVRGEDWIIKFAASEDVKDIGLQEYRYAICARHCGIEMAEVKLFPSERCAGYFGTRRFDRVGTQETAEKQARRVHMVSAAGLLETSHRIPNLDYDLLMKMTLELTKSMEQCEELFRRMCFNVFAHNRDDHSKNFAFLFDEDERRWKLSPAYDMTYSNSIGGEHATTVHGNGRNPGIADILAVADNIGISKGKAKKIAKEVEECVRAELQEYIG